MIARWCFGDKFVPVILTLFSVISGAAAHAHESSTVELTLDVPARQIQAEMDLLDLDFLIDIRSGAGTQITSNDVRRQQRRINDYVTKNLHVSGCPLVATQSEIGIRMGRTTRIAANFDLACGAVSARAKISSTIFDSFTDYRTVLQVNAGNSRDLYVLADGYVQVDVVPGSKIDSFATFVVEGVRHIWAGLDHLAFLLLLVLPLSFSGNFKGRCASIVRMVTAFTVAHSITLILSALGHLSLPSGPVELLIAASVVCVAGLNIFARAKQVAWPLAYVFGLVHGFGFAGAFDELAISGGLRWYNLLAFNLGVEIGQLAFVVASLVVLQWLSRIRIIGTTLVPAGSLVVGCVGIAWIIERI